MTQGPQKKNSGGGLRKKSATEIIGEAGSSITAGVRFLGEGREGWSARSLFAKVFPNKRVPLRRSSWSGFCPPCASLQKAGGSIRVLPRGFARRFSLFPPWTKERRGGGLFPFLSGELYSGWKARVPILPSGRRVSRWGHLAEGCRRRARGLRSWGDRATARRRPHR